VEVWNKARLRVKKSGPTYAKIPLLGKIGPCSLKFSCEGACDLTVFVSKTDDAPNRITCTQFMENPTKMQVISGPGKNIYFYEEYLYMAFSATNDTTVTCTVWFPTIEEPI
jgi:hypothetical protein